DDDDRHADEHDAEGDWGERFEACAVADQRAYAGRQRRRAADEKRQHERDDASGSDALRGRGGIYVGLHGVQNSGMKRAILALSVVLASAAANADVLRVSVDDMIHPISDEFIGRAIDAAAQRNCEAVLIELRTPGGLSDSMRAIVQKILHSKVPVIVFVSPSGSYAASAGFFILESADVAAMAPGTNTGAAHPVLLGEKMDDIMKAKVENDAAAFIRSITEKRGRNITVAESAIRESKSFTEHEALTQKLIDVVAADVPSLMRAIDGKPVRRFDGTTTTLHVAKSPITDYNMTLKEQILSRLMD